VTTIISYIRLIFFIGGTLLGVQVPFFVDQYGKCLESHLIESEKALSVFKDDADKHFSGSLEKLIAHYKKNDDKVFKEGGDSIQSIYDRHRLLQKLFFNFKRSAWSAYTQAIITPLPEINKEVWRNYSYAVKLDPRSIMLGLIAGLLLTVMSELSLRSIYMLSIMLKKRLQSPLYP